MKLILTIALTFGVLVATSVATEEDATKKFCKDPVFGLPIPGTSCGIKCDFLPSPVGECPIGQKCCILAKKEEVATSVATEEDVTKKFCKDPVIGLPIPGTSCGIKCDFVPSPVGECPIGQKCCILAKKEEAATSVATEEDATKKFCKDPVIGLPIPGTSCGIKCDFVPSPVGECPIGQKCCILAKKEEAATSVATEEDATKKFCKDPVIGLPIPGTSCGIKCDFLPSPVGECPIGQKCCILAKKEEVATSVATEEDATKTFCKDPILGLPILGTSCGIKCDFLPSPVGECPIGQKCCMLARKEE